VSEPLPTRGQRALSVCSNITMPAKKRCKLTDSRRVIQRHGPDNKPLSEELSDGWVTVHTSDSDHDYSA
jgi:hypothetical protein